MAPRRRRTTAKIAGKGNTSATASIHSQNGPGKNLLPAKKDSKRQATFKKLEELLHAMEEEDGTAFPDQEESEDESEDEGDDDNELLDSIADAYIESSTKADYRRSQIRFVLTLFNEKKLCNVLLHKELVSELSGAGPDIKQQRAIIWAHLDRCSRGYCPVNLAKLQPAHFIKHLLSLTDAKNGEFLKAYGTHRSALMDIFTQAEVVPSEAFKANLKQLFRGLRKKSAKARGEHGLPLGEGKEPMPFELYRAICNLLVKDGSSEAIFALAFLTLTWNLMCRSINTVHICREHMSWVADSMVLQFPTTKKDQLGRLAGQKRHVYANPDIPEICCPTAVARLLVAFPDGYQGPLFPGRSQYDRFRQFLRRLLDENAATVRRFGVEPDDIGVHSIRKGSATFAASGTTAAVSLVAICARAGWDMGGAKKRYLQWEAAGDQHCGRTVSGLDVNSARFAVSPPFFCPSFKVDENADVPENPTMGEDDIEESNSRIIEAGEDDTEESISQIEAAIDDAIMLVFPGSPKRWSLLCRFLLASLLYHRDFFQRPVSSGGDSRKNHRFLNSIIYRRGVFDGVSQHIHVCYPWNNPRDTIWRITFTGIPPVVTNFVYQERTLFQMKIERQHLFRDIKTLLDERSIGGGDLTMDLLRSELVNPLQSRLDRIETNLKHGYNYDGDAPTESSTRNAPLFRTVPNGYKLNTKMGPLEAWICWHLGEEIVAKGSKTPLTTPPWRSLKSSDLQRTSTQRGYMRNLKALCSRLDTAAGLTQLSKPTAAELTKLYSRVNVRRLLPESTPNGHKRRNAQLTWEYCGRVLNKKDGSQVGKATKPQPLKQQHSDEGLKRKNKVENDGDNDEEVIFEKTVIPLHPKKKAKKTKKNKKVPISALEPSSLDPEGQRKLYEVPAPANAFNAGKRFLYERDIYPLLHQGTLMGGIATTAYLNLLCNKYSEHPVRRTDDFFFPAIDMFSNQNHSDTVLEKYNEIDRESGIVWSPESDDVVLAQIFQGHHSYGHFALLVIDNPARSVVLFDSLPTLYKGTLEHIHSLLSETYLADYNWRNARMPRQGKGTNDCGIFMCLMAVIYLKARFHQEAPMFQNAEERVEGVHVATHRDSTDVGRAGRQHILDSFGSLSINLNDQVVADTFEMTVTAETPVVVV